MVEINGSLNLVFPVRMVSVERPDPEDATKKIRSQEPLIWAYHQPISADIFRTNYRIIAAAKVELFQGPDLKSRLQYAAENGPVIGKMVLLDVASELADKHDVPNMGPSLIAEISRTTTVLVSTDNGFEHIPLEQAVATKKITETERDEVESTTVFFTCAFAMSRERGKSWIANTLAHSMMGLTTSSTPTEFAKSLKPSTPAAISAPLPTPQ